MLKIALCDDCSEDITLIHAALDAYFSRKEGGQCSVVSFDSALECACAATKDGGFDILLLDICMPGMLGVDVAREVRQVGFGTEIVFLTSSDEFAIEAFSLKAAHYLLKPFTAAEFEQAMDTVLERIAKRERTHVAFKARGGDVVSLAVNEVAYVESSSHSQHLHTVKGERIELRQTMGEVLMILDKAAPDRFFAPYKGYIINIDFIRTIEHARIILRDATAVPATTANVKLLKDRYFDYLFEQGGIPWKP